MAFPASEYITCRLPGRLKMLLFLIFLVVTRPEVSASFVMVRDGLPSCFIVIAKDAPKAEQYAAKELSASIKRISGAELPVRIMNYNDIPRIGHAILLGQGDWLKRARFRRSVEEMEVLGGQGVIIRSYSESEPEALVVAGKSSRGTIYAVIELLRRIGVRWYTKDATFFPTRKTVDLGDIEISDLPCFDFRGVSVNNAEISPEWMMRLRLNTGYGFMESELDCPPVYNSMVLTCDELIPTEGFKNTPSLFTLIEGKRSPDFTGRCFSNPECVEIAADSIEAHLSRNPDVTSVIISLQDYSESCQCSECVRRGVKEKNLSGSVLIWVNRVAEKVNRKFPDTLIEMTAAGNLEPPPKMIESADNVAIRLRPDDIDQRRFYEDSIDERTMEFMDHLRGWKRSAKRILVAHPCANHDFTLVPFPDFHQVFKNIDMYHYEFIEGCFFVCSSVPGIAVADAELRIWILSELMWDRYLNGDALVREWMKGVYGTAWGPMMDYFKHVQKIAQTPNARITVHTYPLDYISDDWLSEAERIFQRAFALSLADSSAHRYVMKARLSIQYLRFLYVMESEVIQSLEKSEKKTYLDLLERWEKTCGEFGYERLSAAQTVNEFADSIREAVK
ncbi:MAG: DUF4838 domain-containing protein [Candidatus Latescibacteria bacterium]|jgi:hypothetical protein|nr:DUF4838 domain-containing protein [Candidatus Latescibacterota bacterium]